MRREMRATMQVAALLSPPQTPTLLARQEQSPQSIPHDGTLRTTLPTAEISRDMLRWAMTMRRPHPVRYQVIRLESQQFARQSG